MQLKRNKEMEFETLKKNYKKRIIIGAVAVCVITGALTFSLTKAKYRVDGIIDLAKGTVNYKAYDFKIMAMYKSDDGNNYTEINTMPESGYVINEEKTYCTTDNKTQVKGKIKTENGKHYLTGLSKSDKCYIWFNKEKTIGDIIVANLGTSIKTTIPNFSQVATTDEGVYAVSDGMYGGTSYYWRGAATTNYVKFANFCWRIVRINGDGTIRLIYDGTTCHTNGTNTTESIAKTSVAYNMSSNQSNYVGWTYSGTSQRPSSTTSGTASNAKTQLESWYLSNIMGTNAQKVAQGKYCNDRNAKTGNTWAISPSSTFYYAAYERLYSKSPIMSCPNGDIYSLNVGLITADEVIYAGGKNGFNSSYYLYNGQDYWAMSPYQWSSSLAWVFSMSITGTLDYRRVDNQIGLRPVINLKTDTKFSSGDGTLNNPYVVE